jgi:hypothetical protein
MAVPRQTGLTLWRRDGFGYLAVKDRWEDGFLLTCPLSLDGKSAQVWLNVDNLGEGAWARVEVLDEADRPLSGFGATEAVPIVEISVRQVARWRDRSSVTAPDDRLVTLKVTLHPTTHKVSRLSAVYVATP